MTKLAHILAATGDPIRKSPSGNVVLADFAAPCGKSASWPAAVMRAHLSDPSLVARERIGRNDGYTLTAAGIAQFLKEIQARAMTPAMQAFAQWAPTAVAAPSPTALPTVLRVEFDFATCRGTISLSDGSTRSVRW